MKKIIVGNWKMNPILNKEAERWFLGLTKSLTGIKKTEVVVCPPFLYLDKLSKIRTNKLKLGAQDSFFGDVGPFTGEISPEMLYNIGVKYVILGHSERRTLGETDEFINKKLKSALTTGLLPIVCIGEKERDLEHNYFEIVKTQINECLKGVSKDSISKIIFAYEPVWSISSTENRKDATAGDVREMVIFIRKILSDLCSPAIAHKVRIIYGGSVNEKDARDFLQNNEVSGLLVGKASLDSKKFFRNYKDMRNIKQIKNLKGKKVLVRVDFNVPIKNNVVEDDFRIRKALPTIKYLKKRGAKVILITHLGNGGDTLEPVAVALQKFIKSRFVSNILGLDAEIAVNSMKNGDVLLLENLRNDKGEQACNHFFASSLVKLGDIYVNEAFSVNHREDASIVLLPKLLPAYAGLQLEEEIENLSKAFKKPKRPFLFILGGAKFSTKLPLIKKYLKIADYIFVAGALLNDFLRAKGEEVGTSLVSEENFGIKYLLGNKKIILPEDVMVKDGNELINRSVRDVQHNEFILDIGSKAIKHIAPFIKKAKLILWNGPLGDYEIGGDVATKKILKLVASSKAESIIGGGDTISIISKLKIEKKFSFVSTGGGATLDFLANGTLPGIKALQ